MSQRLTLRFAPEAVEQVEQANLWWQENRRDSRDLFLVEFEDALSRIQDHAWCRLAIRQ